MRTSGRERAYVMLRTAIFIFRAHLKIRCSGELRRGGVLVIRIHHGIHSGCCAPYASHLIPNNEFLGKTSAQLLRNSNPLSKILLRSSHDLRVRSGRSRIFSSTLSRSLRCAEVFRSAVYRRSANESTSVAVQATLEMNFELWFGLACRIRF
jgi:hypothetical protein